MDNSEGSCKYLAIKNWDKYQVTLRSGKKGLDYIKDYTDQYDDEDYYSLSLFERGLLQELRRLRGRSGRNIRNVIAYIASATRVRPKERPCLPHAIRKLVACGFLVLTNQALDFSQGEESTGRGEEIEKERDPDKRAEPRRTEDKEIAETVQVVSEEKDMLPERIALLHPANWRQKGKIQKVPQAQLVAVIGALIRDGPELVEQGTEAYAKAVALWPISERKFVINPTKFWNEAHYLQDPEMWKRAEKIEQSKPSPNRFIGKTPLEMAREEVGGMACTTSATQK